LVWSKSNQRMLLFSLMGTHIYGNFRLVIIW
jgi:hypothetical protein